MLEVDRAENFEGTGEKAEMALCVVHNAAYDTLMESLFKKLPIVP
jgi:hypothetical protein